MKKTIKCTAENQKKERTIQYNQNDNEELLQKLIT